MKDYEYTTEEMLELRSLQASAEFKPNMYHQNYYFMVSSDSETSETSSETSESEPVHFNIVEESSDESELGFIPVGEDLEGD